MFIAKVSALPISARCRQALGERLSAVRNTFSDTECNVVNMSASCFLVFRGYIPLDWVGRERGLISASAIAALIKGPFFHSTA